MDDTQWLTFRKYAKRVKTFHGREARLVPVQVKQEFMSSLQHCPQAYFPLLPNVTKLEWGELSYSALEDSGISLLRCFAGPAVTTVTLSLMRWEAYSSAELAVLADLPKLCPNVTSFAAIVGCSCEYELSREAVVRIVTQWPRLRTLRMCATAQPVIDQLLSRRTLETLYIDYHSSSPSYTGRIPDAVREFTLGADTPSLCTRFLETVYASPTRFSLLIGMNEGQETDIEETFYLLPRRLDTSRLLALMIQPTSSIVGILMWSTLRLRESLLSPLVKFTALHELDLDFLCTAQMTDEDYARMARSLTHLRSLKLGTANPSIARPWPVASVGAVIALLRCCKHLETLHIVFDGTIPPPGGSTMEDSDVLSEALACQGWNVSNRYITRLCVGHSPIGDATIHAMASCFKSIMPCLVEIERKDRDDEWGLVQNMLESD